MKVSRFNLDIFRKEVEKLEEMVPGVSNACKDWLYAVDQNYDDYTVKLRRNTVELRLLEFRQLIATIYDFMGDRGLVNFIPSNGNNEISSDRKRQMESDERRLAFLNGTLPDPVTEPSEEWEDPDKIDSATVYGV